MASNKDMQSACEALGITDDMTEEDRIAYVRLHEQLILEFIEDPPAYAFNQPCCAVCCRMSTIVQYQQCMECRTLLCLSPECLNKHRPPNCAFVTALKKNQLDPKDKGNYLIEYAYALPPPLLPAPAPAYYHKAYARIAPVYLPRIGWLHGKYLLEILGLLQKK